MVCETWKSQLDTYVDGELLEEQMRAFDSHLRNCASCAGDALVRVQRKRHLHAAGRRYAPSGQFRRRMQQRLPSKAQWNIQGFNWRFATAVAAMFLLLSAGAIDLRQHGILQGQGVYSELADLHVATLASSSPVDVVSTDRHTVKPWFQGRIPFTFDLPELQNSDFSLVGGRVTYLDQTPGAHLIYKIRKYEISVFIFQEEFLPQTPVDQLAATKELSFKLETWSHGGLRYYLVADASAVDIKTLAGLLKSAAGA